MTRIRTALFGLGRMGHHHLRTIRANADFELVAVVDRPEVLDQTTEPSRGVFFSSSGDLDDLPGFDCAIVASPTDTHFEIVKRMMIECHAVLVEKPLASTSDQCEDLLEQMDEFNHDARIVVGHVERFNPAVEALYLHLVKLGTIGNPIHFVSTRIGGAPVAPVANVVLDLAVHDLDIIRSMVGPLRVEGSACHATIDADVCDTAEILLSSKHGASATVHVDWLGPVKTRTLRVTGSKGAAFLDYQAQTLAIVRGSERTEVQIQRDEPLRAQLESFGKFINLGVTGRLCTAQQATAAVKLAEDAIAASRKEWI